MLCTGQPRYVNNNTFKPRSGPCIARGIIYLLEQSNIPTIFQTSLGIDHIRDFYLRSGESLSSNKGSRQFVSFREHVSLVTGEKPVSAQESYNNITISLLFFNQILLFSSEMRNSLIFFQSLQGPRTAQGRGLQIKTTCEKDNG